MLVVQLAATPQGVTEESQARIVEVCKLWIVGPEKVLRIFEENQVQISTKTIAWYGDAGAAECRSSVFHVDHSEFKKMSRSEESREGKAGGIRCRSRWGPVHENNKLTDAT